MKMSLVISIVLLVMIQESPAQLHPTGITNVGPLVDPSRESLRKDLTPPDVFVRVPMTFDVRGLHAAAPPVYTSRTSWVMIRGIVQDSSGIARVLVDNHDAILSPVESGIQFEDKVNLQLGDNTIDVIAIDRANNEQRFVLQINRQATFILGKYFALVIAIDKYANPKINLAHPVQDARQFMKVLTEEYTFDTANVTFLENPRRSEILAAFRNLRDKVSTLDNLLVFYAGHGKWDEDSQVGYWLPSDATFDDQSAWISNDDIRNQLRGLKTLHTLLITDACFSGSIFSVRGQPDRPDRNAEVPYSIMSRNVMTSGDAKSVVPDSSVFVQYLYNRLAENREAYLPAYTLHSSVREAVIRNSPINQTPLYGVIHGLNVEGSGGDFIFVKR